jgi:hypothetical protein
MVAVAFGSYASSLFIGDDAASAWGNVFTSAVVLECWGSTWSARGSWIGRSH